MPCLVVCLLTLLLKLVPVCERSVFMWMPDCQLPNATTDIVPRYRNMYPYLSERFSLENLDIVVKTERLGALQG